MSIAESIFSGHMSIGTEHCINGRRSFGSVTFTFFWIRWTGMYVLLSWGIDDNILDCGENKLMEAAWLYGQYCVGKHWVLTFMCVFTFLLCQGQNVTQGQFLSEVQVAWIQSFLSFRLVIVPRLDSPVYTSIYL